jgi:hypothetical protein
MSFADEGENKLMESGQLIESAGMASVGVTGVKDTGEKVMGATHVT